MLFLLFLGFLYQTIPSLYITRPPKGKAPLSWPSTLDNIVHMNLIFNYVGLVLISNYEKKFEAQR